MVEQLAAKQAKKQVDKLVELKVHLMAVQLDELWVVQSDSERVEQRAEQMVDETEIQQVDNQAAQMGTHAVKIADSMVALMTIQMDYQCCEDGCRWSFDQMAGQKDRRSVAKMVEMKSGY